MAMASSQESTGYFLKVKPTPSKNEVRNWPELTATLYISWGASFNG